VFISFWRILPSNLEPHNLHRRAALDALHDNEQVAREELDFKAVFFAMVLAVEVVALRDARNNNFSGVAQ
jgi:hypothetical protein